MWRIGGSAVVPLSAFVAMLAAGAAVRAQAPASGAVGLELPARWSLPPLYPSERLRMTWPIAPLRFTFTEATPIGLGFARGPTDYFVAESVWWEAAPLSLRTRTASEEAIELDCESYTCAPVREISLTTEARLELGPMGSSGVVPQTWLSARYKHVAGKGGSFVRPGDRRIQVGWGGLLDF